jgi:hypothetical protein
MHVARPPISRAVCHRHSLQRPSSSGSWAASSASHTKRIDERAMAASEATGRLPGQWANELAGRCGTHSGHKVCGSLHMDALTTVAPHRAMNRPSRDVAKTRSLAKWSYPSSAVTRRESLRGLSRIALDERAQLVSLRTVWLIHSERPDLADVDLQQRQRWRVRRGG